MGGFMLKEIAVLLTVSLLAIALTKLPAQAADAAAGKARASACAACHGPKGTSMNPDWPNLAGQQARYLVQQLKAFKEGSRKNALMTPQTSILSEADMENLAAYYSSLPCSP